MRLGCTDRPSCEARWRLHSKTRFGDVLLVDAAHVSGAPRGKLQRRERHWRRIVADATRAAVYEIEGAVQFGLVGLALLFLCTTCLTTHPHCIHSSHSFYSLSSRSLFGIFLSFRLSFVPARRVLSLEIGQSSIDPDAAPVAQCAVAERGSRKRASTFQEPTLVDRVISRAGPTWIARQARQARSAHQRH